MKRILIGIIIGLIIVLIYIKPFVATKEGFSHTNANTNAIFPGMSLEDITQLNPINYTYSYDWVNKSKIPATIENELDYNSDVKFMSGFAHLDEVKGLDKKHIKYNPMDASKLYEKKITSI
jgi:hypothetical protein